MENITTSVEHPVPAQDLSPLVGHRLIYTYANGWQYEMYVKNATTIDYRIHSGMVGGRWVKDQTVDLVALADGRYAVTGRLLAVGPAGELQGVARRRLAQSQSPADRAWWQEIVGALAR